MMQSLVLSLLLVSVASFTHSNPPKNPETRKTLLRGRWLAEGSNSLQIHTSSGSASTKERNEHEHHAHHHEAASKGSASKGASKSTKGSAVSKGASKHGSGSVAPPAHHHKSSGSVPPPATGSTAVPPPSPPQGSGAAPAPATGSTATPPAAPGSAAVPPPAKGSTAVAPSTPEGSTAVPPPPAKGSTAVAPPTTGSGSAPGTDGGHGNGETATCSTIAVKLYTDEITAGGFTAVNGFGLRNVPFYDASSGDKLGTYSDFAITPADTTDRSECVATGAFSFMDANSQDVVSTINLAFTCQSSENAIIGGTGEYGCANGYEQFSTVDETVLSVNLVVCGSLCKS
ncbi:hypothetical protein MPSEU_000443700 [Mayamaea pseudoterrestris]|nr:hypothetical protein MPSEU_000443700 [Mayamaea pseudoterrestris]